MKTLRNCTLAATVLLLGAGAAFAEDSTKPAPQPAAQPEATHRHGPHAHHGQQGCHARGEKHDHQKDEKHEHDAR